MQGVTKRFLDYITYDTQSSEDSSTTPSTAKQIKLGRRLVKEMKGMGIDVEMDKNGYVMGSVPSNIRRRVPVVGFIAHLDTSPEVSGKNVKPRIVKNYKGGDIVLNKKLDIVLKVQEFPAMKNYYGKDIIVTDGTTLLGADDKAGIAEIVTAVQYLVEHPEIKHGMVKFAFTPDEEIGKGPKKFNVKKFGADYAYTIDGDEIGSFEYENFNAASATFIIHGKSIHPGSAKGIMKNAIRIATELLELFPKGEAPEFTEKYEGFYHIYEMNGGVEKTVQRCIIRDHDKDKFEKRKKFVRECVHFINKKYGKGTVELQLKDTYCNMKEIITKNPQLINIAQKAIKDAGISPIVKPIRGGTDGAQFSFMGLPTPNLFSGGHNFHGVYEYIPIFAMGKAVEVIVNIVKEFGKVEQ